METLETLIRLAKFGVDEKQRALARILEREAEFYNRLETLDAEFEKERALARSNPEFAQGFTQFLHRYKRQRKVVENRISALQPAILKARDALAEAFEEQKRYEISNERRQQEALAKDAKLEQAALDEVAAAKHARGSS